MEARAILKPSSNKHSEFINKLFHSRNVAHIVHLETTSYAKHKALNEYYDSLLDLTDELSEVSFGAMGKQKLIIPEARAEDINKHLSDLKSYIESNRSIFKESNIQNIIDEIVTLINKTTYLLTLS
jgi:hypothetical protein